MLSPSVSVTAPPESANNTSNPPIPTTRRRGLSYLRNLSQGRSGAVSPGESGRRSYFARSISLNENRNQSSSSLPPRTRQRSTSRPNEPTSPAAEVTSPILATSPTSPVDPHRPAPGAEDGQSTVPFPELDTSQTTNGTTENMARTPLSRSRANTGNLQQGPTPAATGSEEGAALQTTTTNSSVVRAAGENQEGDVRQQLPTLRFLSHQEIRNGRQSLNFAPVSRTLPNEQCIIRVGRYSEREGIPPTNPTAPSDAPVGFKSKVVSRKHCEFSCTGGLWQVKDVGSSSGTFLNHIRLSQPNTESKLFPIKDGDIIQLGIDFRGGEEMIFRCVKIRVEVNRSWQKKPNTFNKSRHAQLQSLAKDQATATANNSGECSICLGNVLPCQALFVAPCAHVWHYKCIRPMLEGSTSSYPQFQCPNCRAYFDLEADVDVAESDVEDWKEGKGGESSAHEDLPETTISAPIPELEEEQDQPINGTRTPPAIVETAPSPSIDPQAATSPGGTGITGLLARRQANNPASPEIMSLRSIGMPDKPEENAPDLALAAQMTVRPETPDLERVMSGEGPMTPMNDVGPFVFDGSAGRAARPRVANIPELIEGTS